MRWPWPVLLLKDLLTLAPDGQEFESSCFWCDFSVRSRSEGVAWGRMCLHIGFTEVGKAAPADPDGLPEDRRPWIEAELHPSLTEASG